MEISEATQAVYLEHLQKLTHEQAALATERTIAEWDKASLMPPIPFIRERAFGNDDPIVNTQRILERGDKPPGWTRKEAQEFIEQIRNGTQPS